MGLLKNILTASCLVYGCLGHAQQKTKDQCKITGQILNMRNEPIMGAIIELKQNGIPKGGNVTDEEGNFEIRPLEPGIYDVRICATLSECCFMTGVIVSPEKSTVLNVNLKYKESPVEDKNRWKNHPVLRPEY